MDRNFLGWAGQLIKSSSLSARRAWIEIRMALFLAPPTMVALRKESVDRNVRIMSASSGLKPSLSARRAWIEIILSR